MMYVCLKAVRYVAFIENTYFLEVNKKKGDIVFLVLYDYKAIRSLGIYSCYSFIPPLSALPVMPGSPLQPSHKLSPALYSL